MSKIIPLANQKSGMGKKTTTVNLGISLLAQGKIFCNDRQCKSE